MIKYRLFKNCDIPQLVEIWRENAQRPEYAGLEMMPMNYYTLDSFVLSKEYFSHNHVLCAVETQPAPPDTASGFPRENVVGFIHGGFGPTPDYNGVSYESGVICLCLVRPREDEFQIARGLIQGMEKIFQNLGVKNIYAGAVYPYAPFYVGLLPGGGLHGILECDPILPNILPGEKYDVVSRNHLFRISLGSYTQTGRLKLARLRELFFISHREFEAENWWDKSSMRLLKCLQFRMIERKTNQEVAHLLTQAAHISQATQENDSDGGKKTYIRNVFVREEFRRKGYARFLVSSVLEFLKATEVRTVELQIPEDKNIAFHVFPSPAFARFATGAVYKKQYEG
ncbi:MAG: GNAT family N-acetyltransferase [Planctomycetia bacterium]|nr:GNAT family N-acetyltransferase [Planctomycetia bacterium]